MNKETSVAPKERVNITYRPATGNAQEEVELPLKLLVLGNFTGKKDERRVEEREPIDIDKDNFNDVLMGQELSLDLMVKDTLSDDPEAEMNVKLDFNRLKDFEPEAIADKVPQLKKMLELRDALMSLKGPLSNIPEFRKKIQQLITDENKKAQLLAELGLDSE